MKIIIEIASDDATADDLRNFIAHLENEFDNDATSTGYPAWTVKIVEDCWKDPKHHECALYRIERLEEALRHISLGSQNSMTYKEDLGVLARKALWLNDTDNPFEKD